jgi:hypothetical protein
VVLLLSLVSFFAGAIPDATAANLAADWGPGYLGGENFFTMFALFFPAVTGIMAGVNMSGDLASPGRCRERRCPALPAAARRGKYHPKNWRPIILALSGGAFQRNHLAKFGYWLTSGQGVLTLARVITGDVENQIEARGIRDVAFRRSDAVRSAATCEARFGEPRGIDILGDILGGVVARRFAGRDGGSRRHPDQGGEGKHEERSR